MVPTSQEAIPVIIPDHGTEQTNIGLPQNLIAAFKAALRGDVINKGDTGYVMALSPSPYCSPPLFLSPNIPAPQLLFLLHLFTLLRLFKYSRLIHILIMS